MSRTAEREPLNVVLLGSHRQERHMYDLHARFGASGLRTVYSRLWLPNPNNLATLRAARDGGNPGKYDTLGHLCVSSNTVVRSADIAVMVNMEPDGDPESRRGPAVLRTGDFTALEFGELMGATSARSLTLLANPIPPESPYYGVEADAVFRGNLTDIYNTVMDAQAGRLAW